MTIQAKEIKGSIASTKTVVKLDTLGLSSIAVQVSNTFVGTLQFEGTVDGSNWVAILLALPSTGVQSSSTTTTGLFWGSVSGLKCVRVRCSAFTSGTISVAMAAIEAAKQAGTLVDANGNLLVNPGALANTTDSVTAYQATDAIMNGATALTPKFAKIALSATGTVVAAVTSKKIRVLGMALVSSGTVNANLQSHTTTATASGLFYMVANSGAVLPFSPVGWFETVAGEALDMALSGSVAVGGQIVYVEV